MARWAAAVGGAAREEGRSMPPQVRRRTLELAGYQVPVVELTGAAAVPGHLAACHFAFTPAPPAGTGLARAGEQA